MFCPKCGRDDSDQHKFCPACGTNLDVVTLALKASEESILTRLNRHLDRTVARYTERLFEETPTKTQKRRIGSSWRLMGRALLTFLADLALLPVMILFLPFRFLTLIVYTPFSLMEERSERKQNRKLNVSGATRAQLEGGRVPEEWLTGPAASVTETTTVHLVSHEASVRPENAADPRAKQGGA